MKTSDDSKMKNYSELIERYIDLDLDADELEWFQNELRSNPSFASDFNLHKDVDAALSEKDVMVMRKQLDKMHQAVVTEKQSVIKTFFVNRAYYLAAAAVAVLLIVGGVYLLFSNKSYTNEQLYSMYYYPDESVMMVRSGNVTMEEMLVSSFKLYDQKNYLGALNQFNQIIEKDPSNLPVQFYSGISNMEINNYVKAEKHFSYIANQGDNLFMERAKWYLGLCYLKMNDKSQARQVFTEIVVSKTHYSDKAAEILKNLK